VNFGEDLEDPRSDRIYSSGNPRSEKRSGTSRDEEFLVPSLAPRPQRSCFANPNLHTYLSFKQLQTGKLQGFITLDK
jgi:hypothetical protein